MNILILGGGGREHALAWAIKQNPKCDRLICAPGNPGTARVAENAALDILEDSGDWVRVRGADLYEGWMHRGYLTTDDARVGPLARGPISLGCSVRTPEGRERALPLGERALRIEHTLEEGILRGLLGHGLVP